jgi:hypothetical protein
MKGIFLPPRHQDTKEKARRDKEAVRRVSEALPQSLGTTIDSVEGGSGKNKNALPCCLSWRLGGKSNPLVSK